MISGTTAEIGQSLTDRDAVRQDVLRVAGNGSFVSRCLLVISRHGSSKNFVTITGEDGLTFGIKDFISDSVRSLLLDMEKRAPGTLATVFGSHAGDVVDAKFLAQHTDKATDRGPIGGEDTIRTLKHASAPGEETEPL